LEPAFVRQFPQHAFERHPIGVLQMERAGDFAGADLAGLPADESEDVVFGGEGRILAFHNKVREESSLKPTIWVRTGAIASAFAAQAPFAALPLRAGFLAAAGAGVAAAEGLGVLRAVRRGCAGAFAAFGAFLPPSRSARASISPIACSSVMVSGVMSDGKVALILS